MLKRFLPTQVNQAIAYARELDKRDNQSFMLVCWEDGDPKDKISQIVEWKELNFRMLNFSFRSVPYMENVKYFTIETINHKG